MPTLPETDLPAAGAPGPAAAAQGPLAGIASCAGLPARVELGPPLEDELPPGRLLDGRFEIEETIGRSGMATIYRARDRAGGRTVAVKVPLRRVEAEPAAFGRFEREGRIGEALDDPRLLRFIRVPGPRSRPYLVTEFVEGGTLACVIHRTHPVPERDALRIASAVCGALGAMHARGIIHRDLKPANIMIRPDGTVCLMDFGLAAQTGSGEGVLAALTPLFGTPEYMAPEQVENRRNDARTDVYSLGVILYQMLTGSLPFRAEDPWDAAWLRVAGDPAAPRALNPAVSEQAQEIVLRALQRRPADRYPDAAAFQADLDAPERVAVTGLAERLRPPRFRLSLQGTPILAGALLGAGAIAALVALFLFLARHR